MAQGIALVDLLRFPDNEMIVRRDCEPGANCTVVVVQPINATVVEVYDTVVVQVIEAGRNVTVTTTVPATSTAPAASTAPAEDTCVGIPPQGGACPPAPAEDTCVGIPPQGSACPPEQCCRPTWECQQFMNLATTTAELEEQSDGSMHYKNWEDNQKAMCCIGMYEKSCPDPQQGPHYDWKPVPQCSNP